MVESRKTSEETEKTSYFPCISISKHTVILHAHVGPTTKRGKNKESTVPFLFDTDHAVHVRSTVVIEGSSQVRHHSLCATVLWYGRCIHYGHFNSAFTEGISRTMMALMFKTNTYKLEIN